VDLEAFRADFVERRPDLAAVPFADFVDMALRGDGDVEGVALLRYKPRRSEPGGILRPVNDFFDA